MKALTGTYVGSIDDKTPININKGYDVDSNPGKGTIQPGLRLVLSGNFFLALNR